MALISCPECGKEISEKALACPNCGNPMNQQQLQSQQEEYLCCPKCGSRELHAEHKGFSGGKALAGVLLTGGIGLLAGTLGSKDTQITCLKCGKKFKAGEGRIIKNPGSASLSAPQAVIPPKHTCSTCGYIYVGETIPAKCPICKSPTNKFQSREENTKEMAVQKKYICSICGYLYNGQTAPEKCPICKAPPSKFLMDESPDLSPNYNNNSASGCSILLLISVSITLGAMFII